MQSKLEASQTFDKTTPVLITSAVNTFYKEQDTTDSVSDNSDSSQALT